MEGQQRFYSVNMFRVCVEEYGEQVSGHVYTPLREEKLPFVGIVEMLLAMDKLFDSIGYPQGFQHKRSFEPEQNVDNFYHGIPKSVLNTAEIRERKGEYTTFDIEVLSRRNTGWQGKVYDTEGLEVARFESEMQLLNRLSEWLADRC